MKVIFRSVKRFDPTTGLPEVPDDPALGSDTIVVDAIEWMAVAKFIADGLVSGVLGAIGAEIWKEVTGRSHFPQVAS